MCKTKKITLINDEKKKTYKEAIPELLINHIISYKIKENPQWAEVLRQMKLLSEPTYVESTQEKIVAKINNV